MEHHHEKMRIPCMLLSSMCRWLDDVFSAHFDDDVYGAECSDAVTFVFAFTGEVMAGVQQAGTHG